MGPYSKWLRMKLSSTWLPRFSEKSIASCVRFNQERNARQDGVMKQNAESEVLQKVSLAKQFFSEPQHLLCKMREMG